MLIPGLFMPTIRDVAKLAGITPITVSRVVNDSSYVSQGVRISNVLILLGLAGAFFLLIVLSFQQRNITVGAWPWQRTKIGKQ